MLDQIGVTEVLILETWVLPLVESGSKNDNLSLALGGLTKG